MKKVIVLLCCLLLLSSSAALADEKENDAAISDGVETWMSGVDWEAFERLISGLSEETRALWNGKSMQALTEELALSGASGEGGAWEKWPLSAIGRRMLADAGANLAGTVATLLGLALLSALSTALMDGGKDGVHSVATFVCRCFTLSVVLGAFASMAKLCDTCTKQLCACMELASPVLMTLLAAVGGTASVGVLQPSMALLSGSVAISIRTIVVPLILCAGVLAMFDHLSERIRLSEMSALLKSGIKWSIGIVTTLYTAITALRSMTAAAFDGVSVRTAKYAAGSMFPMVGGLIGGSFDTVLGCAGLVKNAAGLTTILLCVSVVAEPIVRIGIAMLLFRLTAAAMQPVADKNQVAMCRAGADMMAGLLSACAAIAAMFITTVGLAVAIGNAGMLG